ncbi:OLC1v1016720C1 [Oldenlandia corymbosa var. corymbosa]|uniref:OLC1v1016720C1 n=1 Tax=Oldenlandia corymbosa var. corymbosa TaxID=529605 RepID=A0AAV1E7T3_OLDCO|nr:OLC1v1016720C1 [Oldenlandia corymbosa var. corymbosa]
MGQSVYSPSVPDLNEADEVMQEAHQSVGLNLNQPAQDFLAKFNNQVEPSRSQAPTLNKRIVSNTRFDCYVSQGHAKAVTGVWVDQQLMQTVVEGNLNLPSIQKASSHQEDSNSPPSEQGRAAVLGTSQVNIGHGGVSQTEIPSDRPIDVTSMLGSDSGTTGQNAYNPGQSADFVGFDDAIIRLNGSQYPSVISVSNHDISQSEGDNHNGFRQELRGDSIEEAAFFHNQSSHILTNPLYSDILNVPYAYDSSGKSSPTKVVENVGNLSLRHAQQDFPGINTPSSVQRDEESSQEIHKRRNKPVVIRDTRVGKGKQLTTLVEAMGPKQVLQSKRKLIHIGEEASVSKGSTVVKNSNKRQKLMGSKKLVSPSQVLFAVASLVKKLQELVDEMESAGLLELGEQNMLGSRTNTYATLENNHQEGFPMVEPNQSPREMLLKNDVIDRWAEGTVFVTGLFSLLLMADQRSSVWNEIKTILSAYRLPWIVLGDFNQILSPVDKLGGNRVSVFSNILGELLLQFKMNELPYTGNHYTWTNKKKGVDRIVERFDWAFATEDWLGHFTQASVINLPIAVSNHDPIVLHLFGQNRMTQRKPLRFEKFWASIDVAENIVGKVWEEQENEPNVLSDHLSNKLVIGLRHLLNWNAMSFGVLDKEVKKYLNRLATLQKNDDIVRMKRCWATRRKCRNWISGLKDNTGNWEQDQTEIQNLMLNHFKQVSLEMDTNVSELEKDSDVAYASTVNNLSGWFGAANNPLPTNLALHKRGIPVDTLWPRCQKEEKSVKHLLFNCHSSQIIWKSSIFGFDFSGNSSTSVCEWLDNWLIESPEKSLIQASFFIFWAIWIARNDKVWNGVDQHPLQALEWAMKESQFFNRCHQWRPVENSVQEEDRGVLVLSEAPSIPNFVLREDGAFCIDLNFSTAAWEILDATGRLLKYGSFCFYSSSPEYSEAMACIAVLKETHQMGLSNCQFQSDSKILVESVSKRSKFPHHLQSIGQDIMHLIDCIPNINCVKVSMCRKY